MVTEDLFPVDGRIIQILANDGCDVNGIRALQTALLDAGAVPHVIATHKGKITGAGRRVDQLTVDRSFHTASCVEADAVIVAAGANLDVDPAVVTWVQTIYRHFKPVAAWGDGQRLLEAAGVSTDAPGVVVGEKATKAFANEVLASMMPHRHWDRADVHPTRTTELEL
jgi:catalase